MRAKSDWPVGTMDWCLKRDWIDALRSGEYKQVHGIYADFQTKEYCCLGVERVIQGDTCVQRTPRDAGDISDNLQANCIRLNDRERRDFNYIADWIEDNVRSVAA